MDGLGGSQQFEHNTADVDVLNTCKKTVNRRHSNVKESRHQALDVAALAGKADLPYTASPIKLRIRKAMTQECDVENQPTLPSSAGTFSTALPEVEQTALPGMTYMEYLEKSKPAKYAVGDMVWAKLTGYPWWPCMISSDPILGVHTKFTGKGLRSYHCQFFGVPAERGWVSEASMMGFFGREAFEKYADNFIAAATGKSQKKAVIQKFEIRPSRRPAWEVAVRAAGDAFGLSIDERKERCTFHYCDLEHDVNGSPTAHADAALPAQHNRKRTASAAAASSPANLLEVKTVKKTKYTGIRDQQQLASAEGIEPDKSGSNDGVAASTATDTSSPNKKKKILSVNHFATFYEKRADDVRTEYPEWQMQQIKDFLKCEWGQMNDKQKSRYKSRNSMTASKKTERSTTAQQPAKLTAGSRSLLAIDFPEGSDAVVQPFTDESPVPVSAAASDQAARPKRKRPSPVAPAAIGADTFGSGNAGVVGMPYTSAQTDILVPAAFEANVKGPELARDGSSDSEHHNGTVPQQSLQQLVLPAPVQRPAYELEITKLLSSGPNKKESVCQVCERPGSDILACRECYANFHPSCLGHQAQASELQDFRCPECVSGLHTCFLCKQQVDDAVARKCAMAQCGKFYHEACLLNHPLTRKDSDKQVFCPLHVCASCADGNPKSLKAFKGRFFTCMRCPSAYHVGDFCIAAGSDNLGGLSIVCSNHFAPVKAHAHHSRVNVSWCFVCNQGGTLLCCDGCPAAFHPECLRIAFPEGTWFCNDCRVGKKPLYGDIVWVKLGIYRWWPGEICHPRNVPLNIQDKLHKVGEFPVRFFGSHDFFWTHHARVFLFHEGDKGSRDSTTAKGLAKVFQLALKEATEAFKQWKVVKDCKEQAAMDKNDKKPAPWKFLKTNLPLGNVTIFKRDLDDLPRCECPANADNPCGDDSCLNRMMMYECHPSTCPAGERCQNQRFQKRQYPAQEPHKTADGRGWGLKTKVDIKKGQFVNEYVGELVDEEECKRRIVKAHEDNICNFYMLTIDKNRVIDAGPKGNLSRFMNHSCQPNLETQKWHVHGNVRVGLFALIDIAAGSELTFNYNLDCLGNEKTACRCKAPICSGFLGVRPKTMAALANEQKSKQQLKKKQRKPKANSRKEHEDRCFRCGDDGQLLMCDRLKCVKAYHLDCLSLERRPYGKWECPWHHCDDCGKPAVQLCSICPNSFCSEHASEANIRLVNDRNLCSDHDDSNELLAQPAQEADKKSATTAAPHKTNQQLPSPPSSRVSLGVSDALAAVPLAGGRNQKTERRRVPASGKCVEVVTAVATPKSKGTGQPTRRGGTPASKQLVSQRVKKGRSATSRGHRAATSSGTASHALTNGTDSSDEEDKLVMDIPV